MNIEKHHEFKYLSKQEEKLLVRISVDQHGDYIGFLIRIFDALSAQELGRHELRFEAPVTQELNSRNISAIVNYAKDLILLGDWRKLPDQKNISSKSNRILTNNEIRKMGFAWDSGLLHYQRQVNALAIESGLIRWKIIDNLYRQPNGFLGINQLVRLGGDNMKGAFEREHDVLSDLDFVIDERHGNKTTGWRLTGKGRQFYEEKALPAHNQVFVIAPCREKWFTRSIKDMLEKMGLRHIIQEEKEAKLETIREDMLANIRASRFIIADISGRGEVRDKKTGKIIEIERYNPNCVYELGYAHALNKKIICSINEDLTIKDEQERPVLPFDFAGVPFSFWSNKKRKVEFAKKIKKRIEEVQDQFTREYWNKLP